MTLSLQVLLLEDVHRQTAFESQLHAKTYLGGLSRKDRTPWPEVEMLKYHGSRIRALREEDIATEGTFL